MQLDQCRAVITGGVSGLGLATARLLIAQGAHCFLLDIDDVRGAEAEQQFGPRARYRHTDVTSEPDVDAALAEAADAMGLVTLAVSCAGIAPGARVLPRDGVMPTADFARAIAINLTGTFCVARGAANLMQHNSPNDDGERGVVVNTASVAAFEGQIGQAAYAASKGGIVSLALPLAREFARFGVRVMTVAPGLFQTPLFDQLNPEAMETLAAAVPFPPRLGDPAEYAALVAHIYENPMLNGEVIRLDGALRMQPK